jgi:peptidyl-prolyl cis-trans isomerase B (cyclophilin B)
LPAVSRLLALLTAALVALVFAACGDDSSSESEATPEPAATEEAAAPATNEFLPEGCEDVEAPAPREDGALKAPTEKLDKSKTYVATMSTTCGDFQITLDAKNFPITAGSFKHLADEKFYDGLNFHRIVPDFVIQGGDPLGQGTGGAGYSVEEAPPSDFKYAAGDVAMAKTGEEPAGTSGSQFFVVTSENGAQQLTPDYAVAGKVTEGMDVVEKIGSIQADRNTGMPAAQVIIKSVTVEEQ